MIDLGLSNKLKPGESMQDLEALEGTLEFMPPEMQQRRPYGLKADSWYFGTLLIDMITGRFIYSFTHDGLLPPNTKENPATDEEITTNTLAFSQWSFEEKKLFFEKHFQKEFEGNDQLMFLIHELTQHDPEARPNIDEAVGRLTAIQAERNGEYSRSQP